MKILIAHNNYGKYSGEEAVVDKMTAMLTEYGHQVAQLRMTTEGHDNLVGQFHGFFSGLYSPNGVHAMRDALRTENPDVVNVHNLFPFISPAALFECRKARVPVVMTVHNYRLMCPTGLFMRNNSPCEYCLENGNEWGCVRYNCEQSVLKSIGYAARNAVARLSGSYRKCVTRFACLTEFQRQKLIAAGYDANSICVIPNAVDRKDLNSLTNGKYVAYCGRISHEKGVDMIIDVARRHPEIPFRFAGSVRDDRIVDYLPNNVQLMGYLHGDALNTFYREAAFFVMASRWYEGLPMSVLEAAQYGKITVAPNHGGFTETIGLGLQAIGCLYKPNDIDDLDFQINKLWNHQEIVNNLGTRALEKLSSYYDTAVVYEKWNNLFNDLKLCSPIN